MLMEPDVLLLDEPWARSSKLREHMKIELKALQAAFDTTSSHHPRPVRRW